MTSPLFISAASPCAIHPQALGLLSVPGTYQTFCYLRTFEYHLSKISLTSLFQIEPLNLYTRAKCLLMSVIWGLISVLLHILYFVLEGESQWQLV